MVRRWVGLAVGMVVAGGVRADDLTEFQLARNAYDAGDWGVAADRLEGLLEREPPPSRAVRAEALQFLGAANLFLGRRDAAGAAFERLLVLEPDWEMDAGLFPTPILDEFTRVKDLMRERLAALQAAELAAAAAERRRQIEEYRRIYAALEEALRSQYLARETSERHLFLAFVPYGVGQFQNGQEAKGWTFFGIEMGLTLGNIWTFFAWDWYRREQVAAEGTSPERASQADRFAQGYKIASWAILGALGAVAIAGIIDALVFFEEGGSDWRAIPEGEVPPELRAPPRRPEEFLTPPEGYEPSPGEAAAFSLGWNWTF